MTMYFVHILTTASLHANRARVLCVQPVNAICQRIFFKLESALSFSESYAEICKTCE